MIVRTAPAAVFRYKVTASVRLPWRVETRLPGDVSTISPTGCSDGSGVWRTVTVSKATNQRRSQSGAATVRAGHDTTTVGANAAWQPIPNAMMSAPVSAEDQMPRSVEESPAMGGHSSSRTRVQVARSLAPEPLLEAASALRIGAFSTATRPAIRKVMVGDGRC